MQLNRECLLRGHSVVLLLVLSGIFLVAGLVWATSDSVMAAPAVQARATTTPVRTPAATSTAGGVQPTATPVPAKESTAEPAEYNGLPVGLTSDGHPFIGDPGAPIVLHEYSDYLCPFCGRHFQETYPLLLDEYVASGQVRLVFHDFPIPSLHPTAPIGHQAALCVAEQGPAPFWAMHDALFARQSEWSQLADPAEFVAAVAEEIGADPDDYAACMKSGRTVDAVDASMADGDALGFNATPSFHLERPADGYTYDIVGAYPIERFREVIDAMLAGEEAPAEPTPEPPKLPYWADEGLAPDPERPGFTLAGDPYKGSEDAVLTIVEFSDFQCPACATHALEVQPVVDAELIETGRVRWVFKNFPLRIHAQAFAAATAAECAGDLEMFWPMHDLLFAHQDEWSQEDVDTRLTALAAELDLDLETFAACTASRKALERILPDLYDSQGIVSNTPTFVFLDGNSGAIYQGARDADAFVGLVDRFIETLDSQETQP